MTSRVSRPEDCNEWAGQTGELRRDSIHGEFLASETEPFSDASTLRPCVARTDSFENYKTAPFRRIYLWAVPRRLWRPGVPFRSYIFPFV
ncbi:MAG: hypothetical protein DME75_01980 [Verrucomicrobia bacterium]|nr:MAG: hypothetical protein DME75_01980 [Verrucomicrobiota bacterium]